MRVDVLQHQSAPEGIPRGRHCNQFQVGGVSVQLASDHGADVTLVPSLEPFRAAPGSSDISIQVEWIEKLSPPPGRQLFDSGSVWTLYEAQGGFQFDFNTPTLGRTPYKRLLVDDQFRRASLLLSDECFKDRSTAAPMEYPLDEVLIMHRLALEGAIELHGCGMVAEKGKAGYLFVGHSGAGKSTTARLWSAHQDVEILSDDRIILREHSGQMHMYGTPWHGEAAYASPGNSPLAGIFVLEHGTGNVISRFSRGHAVSELFARSFVPFHRHEYVSSALDVLQRIADTIPCYRFAFEPDERAVEKILNFRDGSREH